MWRLMVMWLLLLVAPAQAELRFAESVSPARYLDWVEKMKVPQPSALVVVHERGWCGHDTHGCLLGTDPLEILVHAPSHRVARQVFYHELGHAFDVSVLTPGRRRWFAWVTGIEHEAWQSDPPNEWDAGEAFADAYMFCAYNPWWLRHGMWSRIEEHSTHRRVCRMIRRAGGWL